VSRIRVLEDGAKLQQDCACEGQVERSWMARQYIMNGYPAGQPVKEGPYSYSCAVCHLPMTVLDDEVEVTE
jgi:hypothetical protein